MNGTIRLALLISVVLPAILVLGLAQQPGEITRSGQNLYRTQDAHDTDQDRRLLDLEEWRKVETALMQELRDIQKLQTGGLIGFGALLTWLQILQLVKMSKSK